MSILSYDGESLKYFMQNFVDFTLNKQQKEEKENGRLRTCHRKIYILQIDTPEKGCLSHKMLTRLSPFR
jgi:hypothetical protein